MKRISYQNGSVVRTERASGPDVWVFRYREDGKQKAVRIGTVQKYPNKASAEKKVSDLRKGINDRQECITFSGLCERYIVEGLPDRKSTSKSYHSQLKRIRTDWNSVRLDIMAKDIMAMEQWINNLKTLPTSDRTVRGVFIKGRPARDLSKKSKAHFKALIHRLFECAIRWRHLDMQRNPMGLVEVRGTKKRVRPLVLVSLQQYWSILADPALSEHVRVMVQIAMCLGLRASEILGLRWEDFNFETLTVNVCRAVVGKDEDDVKTFESAQELPMHEVLAAVIKGWRQAQSDVNGWLFGNVLTGRPFWRDSLQVDHLKPAGKKVGIASLGWHAFRHTYRSILRDLKLPLELQQSLMRHADIQTTIDYGGKTPMEHKRTGNAQVIDILRRAA